MVAGATVVPWVFKGFKRFDGSEVDEDEVLVGGALDDVAGFDIAVENVVFVDKIEDLQEFGENR